MEPNREIWEWLTELTGHEKDPAKRLAIVREIDRLLEERENDPKTRRKKPSDPTQSSKMHPSAATKPGEKKRVKNDLARKPARGTVQLWRLR